MLFSIVMIDKPESAELRTLTAAAHGIYMSCHVEGMRLGGPLLAEDGETIIGSLIIKDFADRRAAEEFIAEEPYNQAGLFETVIIRAIRVAVEHSILAQTAKVDEQ